MFKFFMASKSTSFGPALKLITSLITFINQLLF